MGVKKIPVDSFKETNTEIIEAQLKSVQPLLRMRAEEFKKVLYFNLKVAKPSPFQVNTPIFY